MARAARNTFHFFPTAYILVSRRVLMVIGLSRATTSSLAYRLAKPACHRGAARHLATTPRNDAARNEYQETLNLPKTAFAMRANAAARDHLFSRRANADLYRWQREHLPATNEWHLQDGPPYANGELHMGHALNKIFKDIVNRYQVLRGRRVLYKPGWDTHGLPIELKVFSQPELKGVTTRGADPLLVRSLARRFAQSQVDKQREEFREFGIMADWQNTYQTFDADYQSKQLDVFAKMVEKGLVYRAHRPVYFSPTTRTALAEAELEYNDAHRARSVFVRFPLSDVGQSLRESVKDDPQALEALQSGKVDAIVWTTTPWSLPGNMALAVNADLSYSLVRSESHGYLVVATNRIEHLSSRKAGAVEEGATKGDARSEIGHLEVLATFDGSALLDSRYRHPFLPEDQPARPILAADYVTDDSGTGLVHTAPAHGLEDYHLCVKHGVTGGSSSNSASSPAMLVPIDLDGRFTALVSSLNPTASSLVGASALEEGSPLIISWLQARGSLLGEHRITHRYPYDWRSKKPVMMLATDQWFVDVGPLKPLAREALQRVEFVPESKSARKRLAKIIESRTEWCISRQRAWGVPLPVVYSKEDGEPLMTPENVRHIAQVLREKGADYWWQGEAEEFVAPQYRVEGKKWVLGRDTLDVWFDSGVSWLASGARPSAEEAATTPADLYLEGTDQHRGWFQSSLLTRLAYDDGSSPPSAPFRRIATHGFVLNAQGEKMSKSLNNWLGPMPFIKGGANKNKEPAWGSDVLRFWAAGVSAWGEDARVSWLTVQHAGEAMRKLRNTLRFLLANLSTSTPEQDCPSLSSASVRDSLTLLDKHVLSSLVSLSQECQACYDALDYPGVVRRLSHFATTTLSNVYFAVVKDTLYADGADSGRRQAALAVCEEALRTLTSALAPIAPNLAEEVWHCRQGATEDPHAELNSEGVEPSFFHEGWREVREAERWQGAEGDVRPKGLKLLEVRDAVLKLVADRPKEEAGGSSAACDVVLGLPSLSTASAAAEVLRALSSDELAETFIVAGVEVCAAADVEKGTVVDGVSVSIRPTRKTKCPRCWRFAVPVTVEEGKGAVVCPRCADVLKHHRRGQ